MTISRGNPEELHKTPEYHHCQGRVGRPYGVPRRPVPLDAGGEVVRPGDPAAQFDQVVSNAMVALRSLGADPEHVIRTVSYVASAEREVPATAWRRFQSSPLAAAFTRGSTLLGVAQLGFPDQLVELDVTAALPDCSVTAAEPRPAGPGPARAGVTTE